MRTVTTTTKIYTYAELPEASKELARQRYAEVFGYDWQDEAIKSLEAFAKHFGCKCHWSVDFFNSSYSDAKFFTDYDLEREEIAERLEALGTFNPETLRGNGDCKLTGYGMDEDAIDGFRIAFHAGESDLIKLLQAGFRTWLKAAQTDCENFYMDESFAEHCEANNYEFTDDGHFAKE